MSFFDWLQCSEPASYSMFLLAYYGEYGLFRVLGVRYYGFSIYFHGFCFVCFYFVLLWSCLWPYLLYSWFDSCFCIMMLVMVCSSASCRIVCFDIFVILYYSLFNIPVLSFTATTLLSQHTGDTRMRSELVV